ncbi:DUF6508 domain-containing protein [Streptacidiphilus sp. PB12-B1b]|uniref:DUF6508 domain-containing protein n=1 Tax=Streptacidiphilus sp. PB12-B1b TaxID=2705012 RepID=UPI001CDB8B9E|nr:DUF6508 domain-containing protein [Streptacidiphilus sp. PB12-B1b]
MRRLLRWDPSAAEHRPTTPCPGDPGDAALLARLDLRQTQAWARLAAAVADWRVKDDDWGWPGGAHPAYGERVQAVVSALGGIGAVTPAYHWTAFPVPQLSWDDTYPPADAVRAATAVVRGERFCDGTIGAAYEDGTLHAIATALVAWYTAAAGAGQRS